MRKVVEQRSFRNGLVVDRSDDEGLYIARDVIFDAEGGVRRRGGRPVAYTITSGTPITSLENVFEFDGKLHANITNGAHVLARYNTGSGVWDTVSSTVYAPKPVMRLGSEMILGTKKYANPSTCQTYSTGNVSVATITTRTVTPGGGAAFDSSMVNHYIKFTGHERYFRIIAVTGGNLEVDYAPGVVLAGVAYSITPVGNITAQTGLFYSVNSPTAEAMCVHQGRLFALGYTDANRFTHPGGIAWSALANDVSVSGYGGMDLWYSGARGDATDATGDTFVGGVSIGGALVLLKTKSIWVIRGEFDTQGQRPSTYVEKVADVGCVGFNAFAVCDYGLVFASNDGVYLYTSGNSVTSLTDGVIGRFWERMGSSAPDYPALYATPQEGDVVVSTHKDRVFVRWPSASGVEPATSGFIYEFRRRRWSLTNASMPKYAGVSAGLIGSLSDPSKLLSLDWDRRPGQAPVTFEDGDLNPVRLWIRTHPFYVAGATERARIRAVYLGATLLAAAAPGSGDVDLQTTLYVGELLDAATSVALETITEAADTERQIRLPVPGQKPARAVSVQLKMNEADAADVVVSSIGVAVAPVGRQNS